MATQSENLSAVYAVAARGPGAAYVTFDDAEGFFVVTASNDATAVTIGHPMPRLTTFPVELADNTEYLHLRGRGTATVTATTLA